MFNKLFLVLLILITTNKTLADADGSSKLSSNQRPEVTVNHDLLISETGSVANRSQLGQNVDGEAIKDFSGHQDQNVTADLFYDKRTPAVARSRRPASRSKLSILNDIPTNVTTQLSVENNVTTTSTAVPVVIRRKLAPTPLRKHNKRPRTRSKVTVAPTASSRQNKPDTGTTPKPVTPKDVCSAKDRTVTEMTSLTSTMSKLVNELRVNRYRGHYKTSIDSIVTNFPNAVNEVSALIDKVLALNEV